MSKIVLEFSKVYIFTCFFQYKSNFESSWGLWGEIGDRNFFKDFLGELAAKMTPPRPPGFLKCQTALKYAKVCAFD